MTDYLEEFKEKVREKTDDELQAMLKKPDEFAVEAQAAVKQEVLRRGNHTDYVQSLPDELLLKLAAESPDNEPPEYIDAAQAELMRRGGKETLTDKFNEPQEQVTGKFRKVKVSPIDRYGQYRGEGSIQLIPEGLKINGRHVFTMGSRWGIGLGLFFGSLILSTAVTGGAGYCAPGFIPIYFLVEYFLLKREELLVPYSKITRLGADERHALVGIEFDGEPNCTPVALHTPNWKSVLAALQQRISGAAGPQVQAVITNADGVQVDATETGADESSAPPKVIKPWSKSKLTTRTILVGIGFFFLFYLCCSTLMMIFFALFGISSILEIQSIPLRVVIWILLFLATMIPTYFMTRRYRRKKSKLVVSS